MKNGLRYLCFTYIALLVLGCAIGLIIGFTTEYGDRSGSGCNFYDALLYGVECRGFIGAKVVEILAGFPLLLGQLLAIALSSPVFLMLALPLCLPVLFTLYWVLRRLGIIASQ